MNLFQWMGRFSQVLERPFSIGWTAHTPKFMLVSLIIYAFGIALYYSGRENRRPGEEYGSAKWGDPKALCQKYMDHQHKEANIIPLWLVTLLGSLFITVLAFIMILTVYGRFFKIYMYAALSPVALASFAGEGTSHFGKAFLRSYVGVCMEGAVIVLACIIFSAFSSSGTPVVDSSASVVTQVWSYLGEVIFNLLVLVGLVKSADHIAKEMLGL